MLRSSRNFYIKLYGPFGGGIAGAVDSVAAGNADGR
jgi:hypothetical protein